MITLDSLVQQLGYDESPYYRKVNAPQPPGSAHLFRSARNLGVDGIYVFERAPESSRDYYLPAPAVYVAEAGNENDARKIHRKLWNLCFAPFAIIVLPNQVRVYTGFTYSEEKEKDGVLDEIKNLEELNLSLKELNATAIDTGLVWSSKYAEKLDSSQRVDRHLLKNIKQLGEALIRTGGLKDELANTLIGKYVYLKYLRDRGILKNEWMEENHISPEGVFSLHATVTELRKLIQALEERFNGKIFPINFANEETLKDEHVRWVAAIFSGAEIVDSETPDIVLQLHLPFKAYDFEYIPVETLSTIYEQFIFDRKTKGAVYTPEPLADYVIAEMESIKPLESGMKVLDPACGSGIFLVLIYRLLIEKEIHRRGRRLNANELLAILKESVYGVEREPDACYVAEFSLILTLLHYLEPRDLQNLDFRFPALHNRQVFECDFFDVEGKENDAGFWQKERAFDWIIGNPPWIKLNDKKKKNENKFALAWMEKPNNKKMRPISNLQISEAFSWLVTDLLTGEGIVGLVLPATSLFNLNAEDYRKAFFSNHEVIKVTNFANHREVIFGGRATLPAATIVYRRAVQDKEKAAIIHYAPYSVNQLIEAKDKPWVITVNENEIKTISPHEAEKGDTLSWKLALWGNHIDRRIIERIKHNFPKTLKEFCHEKNYSFGEGPQIREGGSGDISLLKKIPGLIVNKEFNTDAMRDSLFRYSVPESVLTPILKEKCYIRKRGGEAGIKLTSAPHIILSSSWMSFIIYSDQDFVIPPRQIGISAPVKNRKNVETMKALSLYLSSRLVAYVLFFHTPEWGVFRHACKATLRDVREIPTPGFTPGQIAELAHLQEEVTAIEKEKIANLYSALRKNRFPAHVVPSNDMTDDTGLPANSTPAEKETIEYEIAGIRKELQERIDNNVYEILKIPGGMRRVIEDFFEFRLPLDTPSKRGITIRKPVPAELENYARELKDKLDDFLSGEAYVRVTIFYTDDLIESIVEVIDEGGPFPIDADCVKPGNKTRVSLLTGLAGNLRRQVSQWLYVQRGLRLFDGPRIHIYKTPRIIDWTRTQARIDAADIIGELIQGND
ncbi:MAG: N-6 DNA methylase [Candidatus Aminicenantes bacterium]|nr:N-6 DNA methylase [Candidatus Aminicenantes bacterium]